MHEHGPRHRLARRHQQRRPDHRVEPSDVLPDHVQVRGPACGEQLRLGAEPDSCCVVEQRVDPHVDDVLRVPGNRDAPIGSGPRDGEVAEPSLDERDHLVAAEVRQHEFGVLLVELEKRLLVLGQREEVVLLFEHLDGDPVDGAVAVDQLLLLLEVLAGHAVRPAVGAEVDLAPVVEALDEGLDPVRMPLLRRADEVVVRDLEPAPDLGPFRDHLIDPLLGAHVSFRGRPGHVDAVLVGPGQEPHVVAAEAAVPGHEVAGDDLVRRPDMWFGVDVRDR